jgi:F0F1-type ATP synthase membrane subunit b/b'
LEETKAKAKQTGQQAKHKMEEAKEWAEEKSEEAGWRLLNEFIEEIPQTKQKISRRTAGRCL